MDNEDQLNAKILEATARIRKHHPELALYMAEMEVTVPDESRPEMHIVKLQTYYDALLALIRKYTLEP